MMINSGKKKNLLQEISIKKRLYRGNLRNDEISKKDKPKKLTSILAYKSRFFERFCGKKNLIRLKIVNKWK